MSLVVELPEDGKTNHATHPITERIEVNVEPRQNSKSPVFTFTVAESPNRKEVHNALEFKFDNTEADRTVHHFSDVVNSCVCNVGSCQGTGTNMDRVDVLETFLLHLQKDKDYTGVCGRIGDEFRREFHGIFSVFGR
jgi:hypothetical protein